MERFVLSELYTESPIKDFNPARPRDGRTGFHEINHSLMGFSGRWVSRVPSFEMIIH